MTDGTFQVIALAIYFIAMIVIGLWANSKNNKNLLHMKVKTIKESIFYPSKKETMTKKEQTVGERIDQATHTISEKL